MTDIWTGESQSGKAPAKCSIKIARKRSMEPMMAAWIITILAFPLWLSPVQMSVMPISEAHHKFATEVYEKLKSSDIRAELNLDNESLGKKIRSFKLAKIPYAIVIGDKEVESKMLTVEKRDGTKENISVEDLLKKLKEEIKD